MKPQEALDCKLTEPKVTFLCTPSISEGSGVSALTGSEVYNSFLNITEVNNNFKPYKFPDWKNGGVSFETVRDEVQKDLEISDNTHTDLQD